MILHNSLRKADLRSANEFPAHSHMTTGNSLDNRKIKCTERHRATWQVGRRHQLIYGHMGAAEQAAKTTTTYYHHIKSTCSGHGGI